MSEKSVPMSVENVKYRVRGLLHAHNRLIPNAGEEHVMVDATDVAEALTSIDALRAQLAERDAKLARLRAIVDEQAEDDGLWCITVSCAEAYLQQELRRLHAAVEDAD